MRFAQQGIVQQPAVDLSMRVQSCTWCLTDYTLGLVTDHDRYDLTQDVASQQGCAMAVAAAGSAANTADQSHKCEQAAELPGQPLARLEQRQQTEAA